MLAKNGPWIATAAVVAVGLLIWGVVALFSGSDDTTASNEAVSTAARETLNAAMTAGASVTPPAPAADQVVLHAIGAVQIVSVKAKSDGRSLAAATSLAAGQSLPLPNVPMIVSVSAREAVQIGFRGGRYAASGANVTGPGALDLDFTNVR